VPPDSTVAQHRAEAPRAVRCFVLTVSDTRTPQNDTSGLAIRDLLVTSGHQVAGWKIVPDEADQVKKTVREGLADAGVQVIITTGGTGISSRDSTYEALDALFEKRLDGFGELFRALSYQEIGTAAMMTRATAGTVGRKAIFALPGSEKAVRLAMTKLLLPELGHVVQQLSK
jgi:molybdenum cofactor biosynthesis protein B